MAKKLISLIIDTPVELLGQNFIPLNPHISVHPDVVSSEADLEKVNVISVSIICWFVCMRMRTKKQIDEGEI